MSSQAGGTLGTAVNLFSGDASGALGGNLLHGKGFSIDNNGDSTMQSFLMPGMSTLMGSSGGGSSGGGGGGKLAQAPQTSTGAPASGPSQNSVTVGANNAALGSLSQAPSAGQNGMNAYTPPATSTGAVGTGLNAAGSTNTGVGNSQLNGGLVSSSGAPMTMYQMLLQSGRATSGY